MANLYPLLLCLSKQAADTKVVSAEPCGYQHWWQDNVWLPGALAENRLLMSRVGSSTAGLLLAWNSLGCSLCFFTLLGDIKHWAAAARSLQAQESCLVANTEDMGELKQRHIFVALGWPLACQPATQMDLPQLQSVMLVLMGDEGYWAMIRPAA